MRKLLLRCWVGLGCLAPAGFGQPSPPVTISSPWTIGPIINGKNYSHNMPLHPAAYGSGGWYFDFPQSDGVHYVTRTPIEPGRNSARMNFKTQGDATFKEVDGSGPGMVRLFVQRRGDDWSGAGDKASYRFWSPPLMLKIATHQMQYTFAPEHWTNVVGQSDPRGLQAVLADLESVGFTFGGRFAGHGVYAVGTARFVLTEYSLL